MKTVAVLQLSPFRGAGGINTSKAERLQCGTNTLQALLPDSFLLNLWNGIQDPVRDRFSTGLGELGHHPPSAMHTFRRQYCPGPPDPFPS